MPWLVHHTAQETAHPKNYYYSKEAAKMQRKVGRSTAGVTHSSSQSAKDYKCMFTGKYVVNNKPTLSVKAHYA